jgi:parvulin-like peptidyl-prolyl isomerase
MDRGWGRAGFWALVIALISAAEAPTWAADAKSDAKPTGDIAATAGAASVTVAEMQKKLRVLDPQSRAQLAANPAQIKELVGREVQKALLLKEAKTRKVEEQPLVAAQIENAKTEILIAAYVQSAVPPSVVPEPTEAELRPLYDSNKDKLMAPKSFKLAQIVVAVPQGGDQASDEKAHQKAIDLAKQAKAKPADFAALAKASSEEPNSAAKGGELDPIYEDKLPQNLRQPLSAANRGDITEPLRTQFGWHIFKILDIKPPAPLSYEEAKGLIANQVKQAVYDRKKQEFVQALIQKSNPQVNDAAIAKIADGLKTP